MPKSVSIPQADLRAVVAQLAGTTAWNGRAGSGTGSIFTIQFGSAGTAEEKWGEFSLMVYCAWRIVTEHRILLSWHDAADTVLAPGLLALEGLAVTAAALSPWNDLTIRFANGQELQIMSDFSPYRDVDTTWLSGAKSRLFTA